MTLSQIHFTNHTGTETFAIVGSAGGIALYSCHHGGGAPITIEIPDAVTPWLITALSRRLAADLPQQATVAAQLRAIAADQAPAAWASLNLVACTVGRMERTLDELVENAKADWCMVERARPGRPGRT
jgi:hypothetical protein